LRKQFHENPSRGNNFMKTHPEETIHENTSRGNNFMKTHPEETIS
jgi:hypothetical protein